MSVVGAAPYGFVETKRKYMPNNYPEDWNCFGNDGVAKLLFDIVGFY